jgi:hypothetical protein
MDFILEFVLDGVQRYIEAVPEVVVILTFPVWYTAYVLCVLGLKALDFLEGWLD